MFFLFKYNKNNNILYIKKKYINHINFINYLPPKFQITSNFSKYPFILSIIYIYILKNF